jgi:stringent starvation protein B
MTKPAAPEEQGTSTRPYLIRALHEWCTDNGFTPYLAVFVTPVVQVPMEYVKNNEIVLNVGFEATTSLSLGNEFVEFKARFGGVSREIIVPIDHVVAIYARENGQGMAFPAPTGAAQAGGVTAGAGAGGGVAPEPARVGLRLAGTPSPAPVPTEPASLPASSVDADPPPDAPPQPPQPPVGGRPSLKRIK